VEIGGKELLGTTPFWRVAWWSSALRAEIRRSISAFAALRAWSSWRIREASRPLDSSGLESMNLLEGVLCELHEDGEVKRKLEK
jgi:hypothetical protein